MRLKITFLKTTLSIVTASLLSTVALAQFGSKGPYGGAITCVAKDSTNTVYFGTANGGVFQSASNALTSWQALPVGLKSGKINTLTYSGSYLFAGTADSGIYIFNGYVGADRYWKKINNGLTNLNITALIAIDSITVLAGTNGGGIFKTTNKGATWTAMNSSVANMNIRAFTKASGRIFHTSDGGVYASDNNGSTWINFNDINTTGMLPTAVSYNDTTDELLVETDMGLYKAASAASTTSPSYSATQTGLPMGTITRWIANDGHTWYIATDHGVYNKASSASNWTARNNGLASLNVKAILPFGQNLVLGTATNGIYQTATSSPNWVQNNMGLNNLQTYSVATNGATVIAAATEKGIYISKNLANTYISANAGLSDSLNVVDMTFLGDKLFIATANLGVFVSADTGHSWSAFNTGISGGLQMSKIITLGNNIYAINSSNELYKSNGTTLWSAIQTGLPNGTQLTSITLSGNTLLLGTLGNGVYTKPETSGSWTAANTGLSNTNVTSVTAAAGKIYAGTQGNGVFVSDAGTINWSATAALSISHTTTMGLDGSNVEAMNSYGGFVFASYKGGLLASADSGATWIAAGNQFNLPSYSAINKISFVTTSVFVTTEYNSLYSGALSQLPLNSSIDSIVNATCMDTCNGWATLKIVGGMSPYTYAWSSGATNATATGLCQGTYTVTVTDANSASVIKTVTISQPSAISVTPSSTTSTTGSDGSASVTVTGGVSPYTYAWSNGGTNSSITGIGAQNYTVLITDANGCKVSEVVPVSGVVGVIEIQNPDKAISVYPNPSNGSVAIAINNKQTKVQSIAVYDAAGRLMQNLAVTNTAQPLNISVNYPAGVYYVKVATDAGLAVHKLIIQ